LRLLVLGYSDGHVTTGDLITVNALRDRPDDVVAYPQADGSLVIVATDYSVGGYQFIVA